MTNNKRKSGIELLRILGMLLIVLNHVAQALSESSLSVYNTLSASYDLNNVFLVILRYLGSVGNALFITCSFYFLTNSKETKLNKIMQIILDSFFVSVIFLCVYLTTGYHIAPLVLLENLFPTYFGTNWFITCYVMIYLAHPLLNVVIDSLDKKQLFYVTFILVFFYFGVCNAISSLYYSSFIAFVVMYFVVAYMRKYMPLFMENKKQNVLLFVTSLFLLICLILTMNYLGLKIDFLKDQISHWDDIKNPLIVIIAISLFNIFNSLNIESDIINSIASLLMLVYLIHANSLFVEYSIYPIIEKIMKVIPVGIFALEIIITSLAIYLVSLMLAFLYSTITKGLIRKLSENCSKTIVSIIEWVYVRFNL